MQDFVILIRKIGSVSPLGHEQGSIWQSYLKNKTLITDSEIEGTVFPSARLQSASETILVELESSKFDYSKLDRTVRLAILAGRKLLDGMPIEKFKDKKIIVNVGSSRGATGVFENAHRMFLDKGHVPVLASPTTTLGNISSWVMQDLKLNGFSISSSVTCSTALQAVINSIAWLNSGMADMAIAGGAEAPLTAFTVAQMRALRIYAEAGQEYPCMPCADRYEKGSGMVLGEGAALFLLEKINRSELKIGDVYIEAFGYGSEELTSATSITPEADCIYQAMQAALSNSIGALPEIVLMHAPGTEQGDQAELSAIRKLLSSAVLLSNKWMIGHTLAAAGAFNLEYACQILVNQQYSEFPYPVKFDKNSAGVFNKVILNSAGFGGNAASLIVSKKV